MTSIINGLFSGRAGISSHGTAIAVSGDNISNASTVGYKATRAEFMDMIACGQATGKITGAGSAINNVSNIMEQGTLETTGRVLDLAIDGNGYFAVSHGIGGGRYYSRAGNFKIDADGYIVNQDNYNVLGFPDGGTGTLEAINVNTISQNSISTKQITISGNLNSSAPIVKAADIPDVPIAGQGSGSTAVSYADLNDAAEFSTVVEIYDSLGAAHSVTYYYFHTGNNQYQVRGYVNSQDVDTSGDVSGYPRLVTIAGGQASDGYVDMKFTSAGTRDNVPPPGTPDLRASIAWNNGSSTSTINMKMDPFTQYSSPSNIISIAQDGQGVGSVESLSIEKDGEIFAILSNGQTATVGYIGLVNFANTEGLVRVGGQLLQQTPASGEPIAGTPDSGTLGTLHSGSLELSTVDLANEFIKLITLQRGYQANSRIISTIDQLLNEIIQLA